MSSPRRGYFFLLSLSLLPSGPFSCFHSHPATRTTGSHKLPLFRKSLRQFFDFNIIFYIYFSPYNIQHQQLATRLVKPIFTESNIEIKTDTVSLVERSPLTAIIAHNIYVFLKIKIEKNVSNNK